MAAEQTTKEKLAIDGGTPVLTDPLPQSLHGVLDIGEEERKAVDAVLRRRTIFRFLNDEEVSESTQLEKAYRELCGVEYALAVGGGGTCALIAALVGLGIGSGDEVIVPGYTYIATASACLTVGAIPILAEVDDSLTIDPADIERRITPYTRAVIPVHMRGTPADMDPIMGIAKKHDLRVLEDVAQANGASYKGRVLGSIGDAGAFSLQHYKVITAGEGGIITTNSLDVFKRAAIKHDSAMQFWREDEEWESFAGENYRMCELRAALGLVQFSRMQGLVAACRTVKRTLRRGTEECALVQPQAIRCEDGDIGTIFCFFLPDADTAKRFSAALNAEGVKNGTIFDKTIPDRHIYRHWDYVMEKRTSDHTGWPWTAAHREIEYSKDMLPKTLELLGRSITIGINQHWSEGQAELVAEAIRKVDHALA
jgi:8-amino-3,8-dideoxy-alpha-D-manno-octulosonate transaminase